MAYVRVVTPQRHLWDSCGSRGYRRMWVRLGHVTGTQWSHLASPGAGRVNLRPVARPRFVCSRARRGRSTRATAEMGRLTSSKRVSKDFTTCERVYSFIKRFSNDGCVHTRPFSGHAHTSSTHNLRDLLQTGDLCTGDRDGRHAILCTYIRF